MPVKFAPRVWVQATTLPVVPGIADAWPDRDRHCAAYERAQAHLLETRARWTREHPEWTGAAVTTFDARDYAGRSVLVLAPHPDDEVLA